MSTPARFFHVVFMLLGFGFLALALLTGFDDQSGSIHLSWSCSSTNPSCEGGGRILRPHAGRNLAWPSAELLGIIGIGLQAAAIAVAAASRPRAPQLPYYPQPAAYQAPYQQAPYQQSQNQPPRLDTPPHPHTQPQPPPAFDAPQR